ncbi:MAG: zinc ribbon domain-containing protein [bacterium]
MKHCRCCQHVVSEEALACPSCGAPHPARQKWDGWGYEYKSPTEIFGLPLVHISFKYRPNKVPVVARGVIAIGQFAVGLITISQFGIGLISLSQFTIALFALAQFAFAYSLIAQVGLFLHQGHGQAVYNLMELLKNL